MSTADKQALFFAVTIVSMILVGTIVVVVREHGRNSSCAELGGVVVDLKCGHFSPIDGWKP